ncbi:MAG: hypothetical protein IJW21_04250 [Clostridia bacterium]|nr:hypothetical protein [Clostridia bacterium]
MNNNYNAPRKISVLPLALVQVVSSLLLAISARTGFLHIGVFCVAAASAMFALQIMVSKNYMYLATAVLSVCAAFLIGGVFPAAMCAFAVPAGAMTAALVRRKSTKISVVAALDIMYIVLFSGLFLTVYLLAGNEFSVSAITGYFSDIVNVLRDGLINNIKGDEEVLLALMNLLMLKEAEELFVYIEAIFETFKLILPAILISTMGVVAYLTAALFKFGTVLANCELVLPDPKWETLPSKASAVIYSVSYIVYSFTALFSSEVNVVWLVCYSVVIILSPLMMLMGAKWVSSLRNKGTVIALLIFGSLFMYSLALMIFAFFGVSEIFTRHNRMKKPEDRSDTENKF